MSYRRWLGVAGVLFLAVSSAMACDNNCPSGDLSVCVERGGRCKCGCAKNFAMAEDELSYLLMDAGVAPSHIESAIRRYREFVEHGVIKFAFEIENQGQTVRLSQTTEQFPAAEQPGVPPAAERGSSRRERIALCKKKHNSPLAPSEPQPLKVEGKVTRPTILRNVTPRYAVLPVSGTVILQVVIDEDGCVRDPRILRGVRRQEDAAALKAVRQWVFLPATLEGKPVSVNYFLTINTSRGE